MRYQVQIMDRSNNESRATFTADARPGAEFELNIAREGWFRTVTVTADGEIIWKTTMQEGDLYLNVVGTMHKFKVNMFNHGVYVDDVIVWAKPESLQHGKENEFIETAARMMSRYLFIADPSLTYTIVEV